MERRFLIFLVLMALVWGGFFALQAVLGPKRPPPVAKQPADKPGKAAEAADQGKQPPEAPVAEVKPAAPEVPAAPAAAAPFETGFLGHLDPAKGYSMLVKWVNHGAAIERVELNSPRYKSIEDFSGYLGHLDLTSPTGGGAKVQAVGPGTPASLAQPHAGNMPPGLMVGDVIKYIDGKPVADRREVEEYLSEKTHPGQGISIKVDRAGAGIEFTAVLTRRPLEVVRPESHTYKTDTGALRVMPQDPLSLLLTLDNISGRSIRAGDAEIAELPSLYNSNWKVENKSPEGVTFSLTLDESQLEKIHKKGSLKIIKRYTLAKNEKPEQPGYHLDLAVEIHNKGDSEQTIGYRFDGPTGLPTEGWWYSTKLNPTTGYGWFHTMSRAPAP